MADKLWNKYGPGANGQGPWGTAVIDGFDFDFEVPMSNLPAFTNRLIALKNNAGLKKPFYLTAAPQCQWPDKNLQTVLDSNMGAFDAIFVQFYNNQECGIGAGYQRRSQGPSARRSGLLGNFNLAHWLNLASQSSGPVNNNYNLAVTTAPGSGGKSNKPKIFVGVPGGTAGTETPNSGYVDANILKQAIESVTAVGNANFGGVSIWSLQVAMSNGNFLANVKSILTSWK
jgi:chitinase